ncbi:MAG: 50S ribosomal protein L21 [Patescibacteria group bacterium]
MPFAVIETGGKQYLVSPGQKLKVEKLDAAADAEIRLEKVLLRSDDAKTDIGAPYIKDVAVGARVLRHGRNRKIIVFRYHAKTRYRKKKGHRQHFTEIEIASV